MMEVKDYVRFNQLLDKLFVDNLTQKEKNEYTQICNLIMTEDIGASLSPSLSHNNVNIN